MNYDSKKRVMNDSYRQCNTVNRICVLSSHFNPSSSSPPSISMAASSEKEAALSATPTDGPTIFDKIIKKEIPSTVVFEDEKKVGRYFLDNLKKISNKEVSNGLQALAFRDINPQAPTHILVIPKVRDGLTGISKAEERHIEILGYLLYVAKLVAKQEGLDDGYRVVINDGPSGCQSVYHLHIHVIGGRQLNWPPG